MTYRYLALYVYVLVVLFSGGLAIYGGRIYGEGKRKVLGIGLGCVGGLLYLADNWVVLFVWLR